MRRRYRGQGHINHRVIRGRVAIRQDVDAQVRCAGVVSWVRIVEVFRGSYDHGCDNAFIRGSWMLVQIPPHVSVMLFAGRNSTSVRAMVRCRISVVNERAGLGTVEFHHNGYISAADVVDVVIDSDFIVARIIRRVFQVVVQLRVCRIPNLDFDIVGASVLVCRCSDGAELTVDKFGANRRGDGRVIANRQHRRRRDEGVQAFAGEWHGA